MKTALVLAFAAAMATSGAYAQTISAPVAKVPTTAPESGLRGSAAPLIFTGFGVAAITGFIFAVADNDDDNSTTSTTATTGTR